MMPEDDLSNTTHPHLETVLKALLGTLKDSHLLPPKESTESLFKKLHQLLLPSLENYAQTIKGSAFEAFKLECILCRFDLLERYKPLLKDLYTETLKAPFVIPQQACWIYQGFRSMLRHHGCSQSSSQPQQNQAKRGQNQVPGEDSQHGSLIHILLTHATDTLKTWASLNTQALWLTAAYFYTLPVWLDDASLEAEKTLQALDHFQKKSQSFFDITQLFSWLQNFKKEPIQ